jgi:hypothetical protein
MDSMNNMAKTRAPSILSRIRRHHALEHATISILNRRFPHVQLAGLSAPGGFYVYGAVTAPQLRAAITEARTRMARGERQLAVHPHCGTNIVTAGLLVGLTSFLSMLPGDQRDRRSRLPLVLLLSTLALLIAQPLGLIVQKHVTTDANVESLTGVSIDSYQFRQTPVHRVRLEHQS